MLTELRPDVPDVNDGVIDEARRRQRRQRGMATVVAVAVAVIALLLAAGSGGSRSAGPSSTDFPGASLPAILHSAKARLLLEDPGIGYALWLVPAEGKRRLSCLTIVPTENSPDPAGGGSLCNVPAQFARRGEQGAMFPRQRARRVDFGFVPGKPLSMVVSVPRGLPRPIVHAANGAYLVEHARPGDRLHIRMGDGSLQARSIGA